MIMPDPLFDSKTARFDLPLLFAGQAQKELFVNEAASRVDALLHPAVEAELAAPPANPLDGQAWLVGPAATGDWAGRTGQLAARQAGMWFYVAPRTGMRVLNLATGQFLLFNGSWAKPATPAAPSGGTVIDVEARAAIVALIAALGVSGTFAAP